MTPAEKKARIEEIKNLMFKKKQEVDEFNAMQMALKLMINSEYGAMANKHFVMYNPVVANAITAMGRDIIQYMALENEKYWYEHWHVDYELHAALGLTEPVKKLEPGKNPVSIYCDTDSLFVSFDEGMKSCKWTGDPEKFVFAVNNNRLAKYFQHSLDKYAARNKVENIQDFELERIAESIIFLEKKRYVQNVVFEDGVKHNRLSYIYPKGVELVKSSTPPFVREKLLELMKYLLDTQHNINIAELNKKIRDIKNQFKLTDVEEIASTSSLSDYNKWINDDQSKFDFKSGTPFHVKAAAFHNYLLNQHPNLKSRYNVLKAGNKIKFYYCKHATNDVFAFSRGMYPREFAPPVDIDAQFEKTVLNTVNMFTEALGLPLLNARLTFSHSIF